MMSETRTLGRKAFALNAMMTALLSAGMVNAAEINFVSGATGKDIETLKELVKPWEAKTSNSRSA